LLVLVVGSVDAETSGPVVDAGAGIVDEVATVLSASSSPLHPDKSSAIATTRAARAFSRDPRPPTILIAGSSDNLNGRPLRKTVRDQHKRRKWREPDASTGTSHQRATAVSMGGAASAAGDPSIPISAASRSRYTRRQVAGCVACTPPLPRSVNASRLVRSAVRSRQRRFRCEPGDRPRRYGHPLPADRETLDLSGHERDVADLREARGGEWRGPKTPQRAVRRISRRNDLQLFVGPNSETGYDVLADGRPLQVKARVVFDPPRIGRWRPLLRASFGRFSAATRR
jgi:hypothetical protein